MAIQRFHSGTQILIYVPLCRKHSNTKQVGDNIESMSYCGDKIVQVGFIRIQLTPKNTHTKIFKKLKLEFT